MKKGSIALVLVCVLLTFSGYLMNIFWDTLIEWPIKNYVSLTHIHNACFDSAGNIFAIYDSKTRLVIADRQGVVTLKLKAKDHLNKTVSKFSDLAVDQEGNLYVLKTVMNVSGTTILREDIIQYPAWDRSEAIIVARAVFGAPKEKYGSEDPKTKKVLMVGSHGELYYCFARNQEIVKKLIPKKTDAHRIYDLAKDNPSDVIIPIHVHHSFLAGISSVGDNSVVYSTKSGELYHVDENFSADNLFSDAGQEKGNSSLPVNLATDSKQQVYYTDIIKGEIRKIDMSKKLDEPVLSESDIHLQLGEMQEPISRSEVSTHPFLQVSNKPLISCIHINQDDSITAIISDRIFKINPNGKVEIAPGQYTYAGKTIVFNWFIRVQPILFIVLVFIAWRILFVVFFKRRISIAVKQPLKFMPVIILAVIFAAGMVYVSTTMIYTNAMEDRLAMLVKIGAKAIDIKSFEAIQKPADYMNTDYLNVYDTINLILEENNSGYEESDTGSTPSKVLGIMELLSSTVLHEDSIDFNIYTQLYKVENEDGVVRTYICMNDKNDTSLFYPLDTADQVYYADLAFSESNSVTISVSSNAEGIWMYALGKIKSGEKTVGVYEAGMEMTGFIQQQKAMILNIFIHLAVIVLIVLFVFILFMFRATRPLRVLKKSFEDAADGNAEALVTLQTGDESEELSDGFNKMFNKMSEKIKQRMDRIILIGESYSRFFPSQFRRLLHRDEITDVHLGDQAGYNMSILFSNIRSFYSLSEEMTPEENFNFINSYLRRIGPVIPNNSGFVNKYLGAGIMALFPYKAKDALNAAIELRKVLELYNIHRQHRNHKRIDIGIGIHKCPLMVGIVGEEKRVEGAVISEGVNLAETLEKITVTLGASIIVTSSIMDEIESKADYAHRLLGRLSIGDKKEPVTVYDVYHTDREEIRRCKEETKEIFEAGITQYQHKNFADAKRRFVEVIKQNHSDEAAKIYFFLCDEYLQKGVPENWDGTVALVGQ